MKLQTCRVLPDEFSQVEYTHVASTQTKKGSITSTHRNFPPVTRAAAVPCWNAFEQDLRHAGSALFPEPQLDNQWAQGCEAGPASMQGEHQSQARIQPSVASAHFVTMLGSPGIHAGLSSSGGEDDSRESGHAQQHKARELRIDFFLGLHTAHSKAFCSCP